jgi:hypothetical protein
MFLIAIFSFSFYSILPPLKYIFLISIPVLALLKLQKILKSGVKRFSIKQVFPFIVLFLLVVFFSQGLLHPEKYNDYAVQELVRFLLIAFTFLLVPEGFTQFIIKEKHKVFYLYTLLVFIASSGFYLLQLLGGKFEYFLVDKNILSLYLLIGFLLAVVFSLKNIQKTIVTTVLVVFSLFIVLTMSRRGLVVWGAINVFIIFWRIKKKNYPKAILDYFKILSIIVIICGSLFLLRNALGFSTKRKLEFSNTLYPVALLFDSDLAYHEFVEGFWKLPQGKFRSTDDLIINSDFSLGKTYWQMFLNTGDKGKYELISCDQGNIVRISRESGKGNFQLCYVGPEIHYHAGKKYTYEYEFKVLQGDSLPFSVGWYVKDSNSFPVGIPQNISFLEDGWMKGNASYIFKQEHCGDFYTFMNSLKAGSVVQFRSIRLFSEDTLLTEMFCTNSAKENLFFAPRLDRWEFAMKLFKERNVKDKFFGQGFTYLSAFGKQFYGLNSRRPGYPHNPFLSALLYSGIVGVILYIFFIVYSLILYFKHYKTLNILLLAYAVCFVFAFFSGNSHFSIPLFIVLSLIPYFYSFVERKESINS